jgi:hypothetical protein
MEKLSDSEDFRMSDAPPSYFAAVTEQPTAATHPENCTRSLAQSPQATLLNPGHLEEVVVVGSNQAALPGPNDQPSNPQVCNGSQNAFEQVLGSHLKLSFHYSATTVQIRGSENKLVMTALKTIGNQGTGSSRKITFNDPNGKYLMTCAEIVDTVGCAVTAGNRLLGVVHEGGGCCSFSSMTAEGSNGDILFVAAKRGLEIDFFSKGHRIAVAKGGVVNGGVFGVQFSATLAPDMRAMVIAASYRLYQLLFATSECGCTGSIRQTRWCMLILFLVVACIVFEIARKCYKHNA